MGAWDVGMRSNDSALDALYVFRDQINRMPASGQGGAELLKEVAAHFHRSSDVTLCVLGVAEALMEYGVKMTTPTKSFLTQWLGKAMIEIKTQGWTDPNARAMALGRFARRLMGEKISTETDNHRLLEGIQRVMKSRR